ncbi:hypothetical protein ABW636_02300 [Aquimarina sp. 2201CG1-2-11]|uniref:hypothetical protein n=1 Tax=Aquimarina discodermiae TaxID=3231043 RepID=UPI003461EED2
MNPTIFEILYQILLGFAISIGEVFVLIICIYYLFKTGIKTDSVLLLLGSIFIIMNVILTHIGILYSQIWGMDSYLLYTYFTRGIYFLGSILFVIGFFYLIRKVIKRIDN